MNSYVKQPIGMSDALSVSGLSLIGVISLAAVTILNSVSVQWFP